MPLINRQCFFYEQYLVFIYAFMIIHCHFVLFHPVFIICLSNSLLLSLLFCCLVGLELVYFFSTTKKTTAKKNCINKNKIKVE